MKYKKLFLLYFLLELIFFGPEKIPVYLHSSGRKFHSRMLVFLKQGGSRNIYVIEDSI